MRDKINRLAKGINELETPEIALNPESVMLDIKANTTDSFIIELTGRNGFGIKGACFSDDLRVQPVQNTFAGRHIHFEVNVNTVGLCPGDNLSGILTFITNAGEIECSYCFNIENNDVADIDPLYEAAPAHELFSISYTGHDRAIFDSKLQLKIPETDAELEALAANLINAKDESQEAFLIYKEAVSRHLSITHLYESYMLAYPDGCEEELPREVLLYFSYDSEISPEIAEILYCDVIKHEASDAELFESFSARMGAFAMSNALAGRINKRLSFIYSRMIYEDMIDRRAAGLLPDMLKCRRYEITEGKADRIYVCYNELNTFFEGRVTDGIAYVPVYFNDACIRFGLDLEDTDESGRTVIKTREVTSDVKYTESAVFDKPELLTRCFEIHPENPMLLLSACKSIVSAGIKEGEGENILVEALSVLNLSHEFRKKIISGLCRASADAGWMIMLRDEDYEPDTCRSIFSYFINDGNYTRGYSLIKKFGLNAAETSDLKKMAEALIGEQSAADDDRTLLLICKHLFDNKLASDDMLRLLASNYSGSISEMLKVFNAALDRGISAAVLSEKLLTFELFTGKNDGIDSAFKVYAESGLGEDVVIRAYLAVRSADYFLYERDVDSSILFDALYSYIVRLRDVSVLPVVCLIALTAYYADKAELTEEETELCQKLTDSLIAEGLIFRYTKKLRKKIHIPEEICWKYYIEYHAKTEETPKLIIRIMPDDETYHIEEMRRVFKNVFVASVVLFTGDELHYIVYDSASSRDAAEEGVINVTKVHRQGNERVRALNRMMKAIETGDEEQLKESMLSYVENAETVCALFRPES